MIPSLARMSLVAVLTLGPAAVWGCGPQGSDGDATLPAGAEVAVLQVEGMT